MYTVASPDPDPNTGGEGQLPNPNECNSTLTTTTREDMLPLQKVPGQFLGIVGMGLAEYDLPTKPTNTGRFYLGFLGICRQEVIFAKDCWQY